MTDHLVDATKMVCPHCGLPFSKTQNCIDCYSCGSSYCETFKPQWARSMTCLEIENKNLKGDLDLSYFGEDALIANVRNLRAHIKRLEEAGDAMAHDHNPFTYMDWQRAKEAKP